MSETVLLTNEVDEAVSPTNDAANGEEGAVALISDPEPVLKHPLNSTWTLFYFINDKSGNFNWQESQAVVASFNTVEDFWALFNHIENASKLKIGFDYSLFKNGILPAWEDSGNTGGGKWTLNTSRHQRFTDLDNYWLELIMMMVGENEEEYVNNVITGAVVSLRMKQDRVCLWCAPTKKPEAILKAGKAMKRCMGIPPNTTIDYTVHSNKSTSRNSSLRSLYSL